jgi:hypothetical protein
MSFEKIKLKIKEDLGDKVVDFADESNNFTLTPLPGKRNLVFEIQFDNPPLKIPQIVVLKIFKNRNGKRESELLSLLAKKGIRVPRILHFEDPLYLLLEKVEGLNLTDFINSNLKGFINLNDIEPTKRNSIKEVVKSLARWVSEFHRKNLVDSQNHSKVIVLNKGDARLKDFIYNDSQGIFGLDFESSYSGNYLDDLAWIACSFLDTDPGIFQMDNPEHKVELINLFLADYHKHNREFFFSFSYFAEKLIEDLNIVIRRRSLDIGKLDKTIVLKKFEEIS